MAKYRKQHFVPEVYLKRFANSAKQFWAYDKTDEPAINPFLTSISNAAHEAYFYDFAGQVSRAEHELQRLEKEFEPLVTAVHSAADSDRLDDDLVRQLAPHVVVQSKRTRLYRDRISEALFKSFTELMRRGNPKMFEDNDAQALADRIAREKLAERLPEVHVREIQNEAKSAKVVQALLEHFWIIGLNPTDQPFYTSDHPVVREGNLTGPEQYSFAGPGIEIAFPLSSNLILLLMERSFFTQNAHLDRRTVDLNPDQVSRYNRLQVRRSSRWVFCERDLFALAKQTCEEEPQCRDPNRPRVEVWTSPMSNMRVQQVLRATE